MESVHVAHVTKGTAARLNARASVNVDMMCIHRPRRRRVSREPAARRGSYRASGAEAHLAHGGGHHEPAHLLVLARHALHAAQVQHGSAAATGLVRQHS